MNKKYTLTNIWSYIQGWTRYHIYYSKYFNFLMRKHIREQIEFRINSIDKECYFNGSCKLCGCAVTALQMANKQCDKPCYPKMLSKSVWISAKAKGYYTDTNLKELYKIDLQKRNFTKIKHKK